MKEVNFGNKHITQAAAELLSSMDTNLSPEEGVTRNGVVILPPAEAFIKESKHSAVGASEVIIKGGLCLEQ